MVQSLPQPVPARPAKLRPYPQQRSSRKPGSLCRSRATSATSVPSQTLWKTSGLTLLRHRDSSDAESAAFERAWRTLCTEYSEIAPVAGADRMTQNPGGLYVFGASHWAVGRMGRLCAQYFCTKGAMTLDNIHPAFVRLLELVDALKITHTRAWRGQWLTADRQTDE